MWKSLILAFSLLAFLLFAAAWIHLPGPEQDELLHIPVIFPALRSAALYSMKINGHKFPLMIMSYIGALKGWLLWLWFHIVPMGVPGYRALFILAGLATLWLIYWFAHRYWGRTVALLLMPLISTDPSFVHTIRLDYGPVALMHLLKMGGLCLLSRWVSGGSRASLAGGMFLFGLGLWDKANFIWFLAGLGITVVLLFPRETLKWIRTNPAALPIGLAAMLIGAAPFISFNLKHRGMTWRERGRLEIRWFKLLQAEGTINGDFMSALTGEDLLDSAPPARDIALPGVANWMYRVGRLRQTIILPLLGLVLLALPLSLWRAPGRRKTLLFPLFLAFFTFACMFITFDGGSSVHHVIMVQPFPLLFLAASLYCLSRWIAVPVVLAAVLVNLSLNARHLAIYTRTGGTGGFTDASYRLVHFLAQHPESKLYAIDWGISNPVIFLGSRWNLGADDLFFSLNSPDDPNHPREVERLAELMLDSNNVFLLHSPQRTLFPAPADAFFSLAESRIPMRQIAFFQERGGPIAFEVYHRGEPAGSRKAPPEVEVRFSPDRAKRGQEYVIEVKEFRDTWIDVVYHVGRVSGGMATRFCRLDAEGRGKLTVPADHPAATVRIVLIRPTGREWRPARGSITVIE